MECSFKREGISFADKPYKRLQTLNNICNLNNNEKITPKIFNSTFVLVGGYFCQTLLY